MKLSLVAGILITIIGSVLTAENYLPQLPPNSTCEDAPTYSICRSNALSANCPPSDNLCNCRQAQNLLRCLSSCTREPTIAKLSGPQSAEVQKYCPLVPTSLLTAEPTMTSPASSASSSSTTGGNTRQSSILNSAGHQKPLYLLGGSMVVLVLRSINF
ncbi:hypothetical protein K493DRAFT_36695 [Basidiobolus meristosporus CBS 931.73]|uniref:Extracellular membrane protein CFEM domain-containing protein n=1 Tax=Basidiobolus meristosporus CBS 931.73 TaxID=1314790 RepID=A0A1Y1Y692_9FUNG|nr:hypothetical protein K493DRAFT_36695 [Basidiobolus meristosporus CBS 931.73]|eukprot:ORX93415.1 hypothetical protein K493DRAFT_36695 [Basidiobolus meristosporus CBS 931.73]